jgi:hypothetical protein
MKRLDPSKVVLLADLTEKPQLQLAQIPDPPKLPVIATGLFGSGHLNLQPPVDFWS